MPGPGAAPIEEASVLVRQPAVQGGAGIHGWDLAGPPDQGRETAILIATAIAQVAQRQLIQS